MGLPIGDWGAPQKRGRKSCRSQRGWGTQEEHRPQNQIGRTSHKITKTEVASTGPAWACIYVIALSLVFLWDP